MNVSAGRMPAGVIAPWDESVFAELIEDMVVKSAPRAFAVVQVYGERLDARIAAWGLAREGQAEIFGVDGGLRMCVRSPERACWMFGNAADISTRLVWLRSRRPKLASNERNGGVMRSRDLAALQAGFGWAEGVPRFACRWTIKANTHDLQWCTTIFDLLPGRAHVAVYPGAVSTYAVRLDRAGIDMLADTLESRDACAVPALHPVHGARLLALRPCVMPHEPPWTNRPADAPPYRGPMELAIDLPRDAGIRVLFFNERVPVLTETLAEIQRALA